jgi:hypothetical protein
MSPARGAGPSGVTSPRALRVRLAAGDLCADAAAVCADVVERLAATGAEVVLADVVTDDDGRGTTPDAPRLGPTSPDGACPTGTARHRGRRVDLGTLDGLARLELAVRRAGARLELVGAAADLRALLLFTGLADVLAVPRPGVRPDVGPDAGPDAGPDGPDHGLDGPDGPDAGPDARTDDGPAPASGVEVRREAEGPEVVRPDEVRDAADAAVADLEQMDRPRHESSGPARLVLGESP